MLNFNFNGMKFVLDTEKPMFNRSKKINKQSEVLKT